MGYNKTNWSNGDIITAEKLNNIEEGIIGAAGYEAGYQSTLIFENNITAEKSQESDIAYGNFEKLSSFNDATKLLVTIDGVKYLLPKADPNFPIYGEVVFNDQHFPIPVFDNYPCAIYDDSYGIFVIEESGTYQVKIESLALDLDISEEFVAAVSEAALKSPLTISLIRGEEGSDTTVVSMSWSIILQAFSEGRDIVLLDEYFHRYLFPISFVMNSGQDISAFCYINYDGPGDGTLSKIEIYQLYNNSGSTSLSCFGGSLSSSSSGSPK